MELLYKHTIEPYGVILFAARFGDKWGEIPKEKELFIHEKDYATVADAFVSCFPARDPETGEMQEYDAFGMNWMHKELCTGIITRLEMLAPLDTRHARFIADLCAWMEEQLAWADEIMLLHTI